MMMMEEEEEENQQPKENEEGGEGTKKLLWWLDLCGIFYASCGHKTTICAYIHIQHGINKNENTSDNMFSLKCRKKTLKSHKFNKDATYLK